MPAVALAACLALCRCGADLGDELKAIVTRDECLSADEARQLGFEMTTAIARAREEVANARRDRGPCSGPLECPTCVSEMQCCLGTHICLSSFTHSVLCSQSPNVESALAAIDVDSTLSRESLNNVAHFRSNSMGANQGDVYLKVEDAIICLHSHHLNRATHVFRNQLSAPINPGYAQEGASPSCPLLLPDDKEIIWKDLLWFFYDSPYQRSLVCNVGGVARWRSVLELGTKYEMKDKIRLYDQHQLDPSLVQDALRTICRRTESLTPQEAEELGYARTMEIAKKREDSIHAQLDLARAELEAAKRKLRRQTKQAIQK
ncbi:hypothetical protein K523DRAFT_6696 [Schizophyllum commune Tattone D]|nr:hypothetical protein K523DRAFT_6696 [Schizophyllum commune Tattone D]